MTDPSQTGSHPADPSGTDPAQTQPLSSEKGHPDAGNASVSLGSVSAESVDDIAPDWASALAEQESLGNTTQADGLPGADEWAQALAAQSAGEQPDTTRPGTHKQTGVQPAHDVFEPLRGEGTPGDNEIDLIMDIPVQLSVELGRTKLTIRNILQLGQGSVVELDSLAGEPMDIFVNGYLIAQGEVVVVDDKYGIRLTDIITPADRLGRINGGRRQ